MILPRRPTPALLRTFAFAIVAVGAVTSPSLGQEAASSPLPPPPRPAASPFDTAPLSDAEAAAPAAPIRPSAMLSAGSGFGDVGDLDSYANAGNAGFSTSRSDINQDIGLTPVIEILTPKVTTKGGGF